MNRAAARRLAGYFAVALIFVFAARQYEVTAKSANAKSAKATAALTWNLCDARNRAIITSNQRWALVSRAWLTASNRVRAQALLEPNSSLEAIDKEAARTYLAVSEAIVPYETIPCGPQPS